MQKIANFVGSENVQQPTSRKPSNRVEQVVNHTSLAQCAGYCWMVFLHMFEPCPVSRDFPWRPTSTIDKAGMPQPALFATKTLRVRLQPSFPWQPPQPRGIPRQSPARSHIGFCYQKKLYIDILP